MKLSLLKAVCGFTAALLLAQSGWAQTAPSAPARRINPGLHMIITPGVSLTMDGNRVLAKTTRHGITTYHYEQGRLVRARHGNGKITHYHYRDNTLDRIVLPDGTIQTPVYVDGTLAMLESSSGKKLGLSAAARDADKMAYKPRLPGAGPRAMTAAPARSGRDAINRTLIAVDNWEAMKTGWDCTIQPEGDTVCIGMPDSQPPSGVYDGGWMPADPGPVDGGLGSTPGDAGGGVPGEGSDRIPPNLNTQESCIAAAKNTWEIMRDEFCPMVRDQAVCLRQNWALFLDLRQECISTFPLP